MQIGINLFNYHIGWETHSCDIEAAFLEPTMDNVMYIEPHQAMVECGFKTEEQRKQLAIRLRNLMYRNVNAAIKFFKVLTRWIVDNMKMQQSLADPCVFYKLDKNDKLELMVGVTVDGCAVTGLPLNIEWFMKGLGGRFKITRGGLLKKHLGVNYEWGVLPNGKSFCRATMEKKVNALVEAYIKHIGKEAKNFDTPGKPHKYLSKSKEDEPVDIDQYRSFVGQLMCLPLSCIRRMECQRELYQDLCLIQMRHVGKHWVMRLVTHQQKFNNFSCFVCQRAYFWSKFTSARTW